MHLQAQWVGQGWQSAVSTIDMFLASAKPESATLFGGLACPMLNGMLASGDDFVQGVAARVVQGVVKHDAAVMLASGLDLASLVQLLMPSSTAQPIKQLVAFILAKVFFLIKCEYSLLKALDCTSGQLPECSAGFGFIHDLKLSFLLIKIQP